MWREHQRAAHSRRGTSGPAPASEKGGWLSAPSPPGCSRRGFLAIAAATFRRMAPLSRRAVVVCAVVGVAGAFLTSSLRAQPAAARRAFTTIVEEEMNNSSAFSAPVDLGLLEGGGRAVDDAPPL